VAREFLLENGASEDQADSVCESIILHQDVGSRVEISHSMVR
jgi:hypothetical protein